MHDGMPYGRNQGQGQGHSRKVDRQSPRGTNFLYMGLLPVLKLSCLCVYMSHPGKLLKKASGMEELPVKP